MLRGAVFVMGAWVGCLALVSVQGCDSGGASPDFAAEAVDAPAESAVSAIEPTAAQAGVAAVLSGYERLRSLLAGDAMKAVGAAATQLADGANQAAKAAPEEQRAALQAVAAAAQRLADMPKEDPAKIRVAFGEVSRPLVNLMTGEPELRSGWHLFECPMAEGYPRWLQPSATISNPYMGKRMPRCGAERTF